MRIGNVVGKLSLSRLHPALAGQRWVLITPRDLKSLASAEPSTAEELVVLDELGVAPGCSVGFSEGMEASFPFLPDKKPIDAYVACLLDTIELDEREVSRLL